MDTRTFLGLEPTHNRFRWKLPVTTGICTGGNFMFGGAGLGAAIAAMEGTSGRRGDLGDGAVPVLRPARASSSTST